MAAGSEAGKREHFLVLGSNCFSGACFIDYLLRDNPAATVTAVSRSPEYADFLLPYRRSAPGRVVFHQLDLNRDVARIVALAGESGCDYLVNFAAQGMVAESWSNPEEWYRTNSLGPLQLAAGLTAAGVKLARFVQISSPEVYGASGGECEENARYRPSTPYAASKAGGDLGLYPYFLHRGLPLVYTRATNVYGPHQQPYRIIPRAVLFIKEGRKIQLHGGGRAVKSYLHIRDVCDATLRIARHGRNGECYHISPDGAGISIYELVARICARLGRELGECVELVGERLGQDRAYVISSAKVREELGWRPRIGLDEGLAEVIAWVEENQAELLAMPRHYIHKP